MASQLGHVLVDVPGHQRHAVRGCSNCLVGERGAFTAGATTTSRSTAGAAPRSTTCQAPAAGLPRAQGDPLEQNYRSTSAILRAANNVIAQPQAVPQDAVERLGEGEPMRVVDADGEEHEAERAVARIQAIRPPIRGTTRNWSRTSPCSTAPTTRRACSSRQAAPRADPLQGVGRPELFDRAEIKDLCAWLRLLVNNDDDPAFLRAVTTPKRGIGHQTLGQPGRIFAKWKLSLFEALFSTPSATVARAGPGRPTMSSAAL